MKSESTKKLGIWILAFALFMAHLFFRNVAHAGEPALLGVSETMASESANQSWKQIFVKGGECSIAFPAPPQLLQQALNLSEGQKLFYDIYLAPFENKGVFLLMIATYPSPMAPGYEMAGVEGLLKGIVSHHPDNKLVFMEKVEIGGHPAINFLVQSGTNYFRGQSVMVGNKLFLIAMEGQKDLREENVFLKFVKSFQLLLK